MGKPNIKKRKFSCSDVGWGAEWCFWSSWHRGLSLAKFNLPRWWLSIFSLTTSRDQSFFTTKLLPFSVQLKAFQIVFFPLSPDKPSYHPLALVLILSWGEARRPSSFYVWRLSSFHSQAYCPLNRGSQLNSSEELLTLLVSRLHLKSR